MTFGGCFHPTHSRSELDRFENMCEMTKRTNNRTRAPHFLFFFASRKVCLIFQEVQSSQEWNKKMFGGERLEFKELGIIRVVVRAASKIIQHERGWTRCKLEDFRCIDLKRGTKVAPQNKTCLFNFSTANALKLFSFAPYVVSGLWKTSVPPVS